MTAPHPFRHPWPRNDRCLDCGEYEEDGPHIAMAVHHIDGDPTNNDPENVRLVPIAATHRYRPCKNCGGSPDIHNANRGRDWIGHEYR